MIRCKDCRFWKQDFAGAARGECQMISRDENGYTLQHKGDPSIEPLAAAGAIELPSWLATSPEFGCVLGEREGSTQAIAPIERVKIALRGFDPTPAMLAAGSNVPVEHAWAKRDGESLELISEESAGQVWRAMTEELLK